MNVTATLSMIPGYDPFATAGDSWFDEQAAENACNFFPSCLHHIEGTLAGESFKLEPWQQAIVANLFGWKRKDSKGRTVRRYRQSLIFVPRKNGKTPLAAGIGLYCLLLDPERGQQNYIAASTREQAGLLFRHCRGMIDQEPKLSELCRVYGGHATGGQSQSIVIEQRSSFLKIISADVSVGKHGKNLNLAIVDELHEQPGRDLVDTLRTSMASANKPQPLMIYTTTSDYEREGSICNEIHNYACQVRDGIVDDPKFLPVIYEATKAEDWTSPAVWAKANPNLGVSVSEEFLVDECKKAKENPALENLFKRLHLNLRTEQAERMIPMDAWDRCGGAVRDVSGRECYGGLDLGIEWDLSALVLAYPDADGTVDIVPYFWSSHQAANKTRGTAIDYYTWARQGLLTIQDTDGAIDQKFIRQEIFDLDQKGNLQTVGYDPWNAAQLCQRELSEQDGVAVVEFRQGYLSMNEPCKRFVSMLIDGKIRHGNHPILRWMACNVAARHDPAGNVKPDKSASGNKIDGIVAAIMAVDLATRATESAFDQRGEILAI